MLFAIIELSDFLNRSNLMTLIRIAILAGVGFPFSFFLSLLVVKSFRKSFTPQTSMLVKKGIFYTGCTFVILGILNEFGFNITALWGAAGVAGIAIGFASQTSVSNIISGIFLVSEQPFQVGDFVKIGETAGTVLSVDLLSVKLRTRDNQFVRIPNEYLIKNQMNNFTHFPLRRIDINLGVAYKEDISRVQGILKDIAAKNTHCLDEPEPLVIFSAFGSSSIDLILAVWCVKADYLRLKQSIMLQIKERFDAEGVEIPFPHRTLYTGSATEPMPVKIVAEGLAKADK